MREIVLGSSRHNTHSQNRISRINKRFGLIRIKYRARVDVHDDLKGGGRCQGNEEDCKGPHPLLPEMI